MSIEGRKSLSLARKGISRKQKGQFQSGHIAWNKKRTKRQYIPIIYHKGKKMPLSHSVYLRYHDLKQIPKGFVVHHKDENPENNDISNLRLMRWQDHNYMHNILDRERASFKLKVQELLRKIEKEHNDWVNNWGADLISKEIILKVFGPALCEPEVKG
jgi:hypothetical protein